MMERTPTAAVVLEGADELARLLGEKLVGTAALRAINKAADAGRAEATRRIYAGYGMKKADINKAVSRFKVTASGQSAVIRAKGRSLSLIYFGAQQFKPFSVRSKAGVKTRKRNTGKSGVYAKILRGGDVTHKPHAFIAAVKTRRDDIFHTGVFERIPGSRMASNPKKEKIVERRMITVASLFGKPEVWNPTVERTTEVLHNEFNRQISLAFAKGK